MHYNSGNLPSVQITQKISEYTERSVNVLSLRLSCTQDHAHKITLFKINTWGCVCGGGGGGSRGLLFEIDKMLFVSLGGIKITPGCSEWKPNVFTLGGCLERGKSRSAVWEDDPLSNAREKSPAIP